jgi:hypothetical protein
MYKNEFQTDYLSILYSIGIKPLEKWNLEVKNGHIKRVLDNDMQSSVLEIIGANINLNSISLPASDKQSLGIQMPHFVMQVKNLKKYFSFEVTVSDDKGIKRVFKACNFHTLTRVKTNICIVPLKLEEGWNQIFFNLNDFVKRAYSTNYKETTRVQINANCRIKRVYFTDQPQNSRKIPPEFKAFVSIEEDGADKLGRNVIEEVKND